MCYNANGIDYDWSARVNLKHLRRETRDVLRAMAGLEEALTTSDLAERTGHGLENVESILPILMDGGFVARSLHDLPSGGLVPRWSLTALGRRAAELLPPEPESRGRR
jgi:DNA-binding IclR family transcriptional regulator